jgi:hypothetical protein
VWIYHDPLLAQERIQRFLLEPGVFRCHVSNVISLRLPR